MTPTGNYLAARLAKLCRRARPRRGARHAACCSRSTSGQHRAPRSRRAALERGLLINAPRPDTLRFMPALNVTHSEIDQMLFLLSAVLRES